MGDETDRRAKRDAGKEASEAARLEVEAGHVVEEIGNGTRQVRIRRRRKRVSDSRDARFREDGRANQDYFDPNRSRVEREEDAWHRRKKGRTRQRKLVMVWLGSGTLVLACLIGLIVWQNYQRKPDLTRNELVQRIEIAEQQRERREQVQTPEEKELFTALEQLALNLPRMRERAMEIIKAIREAESFEDLEPLLIDYPDLEEDVKRWLAEVPTGKRPRTDGVYVRAAEADGAACIHLMGQRQDFTYFVSYLVEGEEGQLLFDWESFLAKSEIPIRELAEGKAGGPVDVRAMLSEGEFYTPPVYNDHDWSCYLLRTLEPLEYVWAYTPRRGPVDRELRHHLAGRFIGFSRGNVTDGDLGGAMKAFRLRIRPAYGAQLEGQYEIVEILSHGWLENRSGGTDE